jgi:hypothetical protein
MKRSGIAIFILLIIVLMPGCQKAPDDVKDRVRKSEINYTDKSDLSNKLQYDTIDNIFPTIDQVKKGSYSNLSFPSDFSINKPAEIGQMEFTVISEFDKNYKEICKDFIGEYDKKYLAVTPPRSSPSGYLYDDKNKLIHLTIGNDGLYFYYNNEVSAEYIWNSTNTVIKKIFLQTPYEDVSYHLKDGDMKISEVIELANSYVKDKMQKYSKDITLLPYDVIIYQKKDGNYLYNVEFNSSYKGLYFTNLFYQPNDVKTKYTSIFLTDIIIDSKSGPSALDNPYIFKYNKTREKYEKIVTFECATKIVEKLLSSYTKYKVQCVSLETRLIQKGGQDDQGACFAGMVYETKPCWVFYLDRKHGKEIAVIVDCETGETEFINNADN